MLIRELSEAADPWKKNADKVINGKYLYADQVFNRAQFKTLNKIREYGTFVDTGLGRVLVRKADPDDFAKFTTKEYVMANAKDQKYIMNVVMNERGKLFSWELRKKEGNILSLIKAWSVDEMLEQVESIDEAKTSKADMKKHIKKLEKMYKDAEAKFKKSANYKPGRSSVEMMQIADAIGQYKDMMGESAELDEITLDETQDFHEEFGMLAFAEEEGVFEAEYQGRKVKLNKPMRGDVKKFKVYVKNDKGNVVKVNFGDPNMRIKKSNPERRKSFRARHNCDNPGPKWKARYWSCRKW